ATRPQQNNSLTSSAGISTLMRPNFPPALAALTLLILSVKAYGHEGMADMPMPAYLGAVSFETSCKPQVKADFNRAVALCTPSGTTKQSTRLKRWQQPIPIAPCVLGRGNDPFSSDLGGCDIDRKSTRLNSSH